MSKYRKEISIISSISELSRTVDVWFLDIWGVIHNGVVPFENSVLACQSFRKRGGYILLLTNAPRTSASVIAQLDQIGVPRSAYNAIVTSGDVTRGVLKSWLHKSIYHLGPIYNTEVFQGLKLTFSTPLTADTIVCTGLLNDEKESPNDYLSLLNSFQSRSTRMLCVNPDLKIKRGNKTVYCAGAIAQIYENLGGEVIYSGKPYAPIYDFAFNKVSNDLKENISKERILAIGDGVLTDINGAATVGIQSVFIASGIHMDLSKSLEKKILAKLFYGFGNDQPVAAMSALKW
ncbi:MAG: TIGR01459 family HAD-type hydrolase [Hyphomicrobiaceae bacterium]|nr:TIGR01459 family HAD-type hydrolase [Hyphomicrobiaceae bacterium]